jgi:hypothetical protein
MIISAFKARYPRRFYKHPIHDILSSSGISFGLNANAQFSNFIKIGRETRVEMFDLQENAKIWTGRLGAYTLSFIAVTGVLVYLLDLPGYLSGAPKLVHEYYYTNFWYSAALDFFLIAAYISAGMYVSYGMGWSRSKSGQIAGIILASVLISGAFMAYFITREQTPLFFSKWFHSAGASAILYDVILVSTVYWVAAAGKQRFNVLSYST